MKVGDLVRHDPEGDLDDSMKEVIEGSGWMPDFSVGVIIDVEDNYLLVYCLDDNMSDGHHDARWYQQKEIRKLNNK